MNGRIKGKSEREVKRTATQEAGSQVPNTGQGLQLAIASAITTKYRCSLH